MKYDSDILTLIYSMNENQRIDFSILINNMKNDLDKNLLKFGSNFTCDLQNCKYKTLQHE